MEEKPLKKALWTRIPEPIESETDRRALVAILAIAGLEVRVVKERLSQRGAAKRFVEFRAATAPEQP